MNDSLSNDIMEFLQSGINSITRDAQRAADECSQECLENIKNDSPVNTGSYKCGWVRRKTKDGYVIYNKTRPSLEMPLEYGHIITEGPSAGQRVPAKPHIYKNADEARDKFYNKCLDIARKG